MSFHKTVLTLASVSLLTPVIVTAQGVSRTSNPTSTLQPVMVYASRFEEKAADVSPQTTIITSNEILNSGSINVSDVLSRVAGLPSTINQDGSTNAVVDMRGFGDTASNNVVVLLDGVRISENEQVSARTSMIPLEIIDHIEVTHGGNSVLYGDGATSGTINIVTKKAIGEITVVSGGIASYAGFQSNLFHAREMGGSQLSVFARGLTSNGYRDGTSTREKSAGLNWTTNIDSTSVAGIRLISSWDKNMLPGPLPSIWLNSAPTRSDVPGYQYGSNTNTSSISLFGTKKINNAELTLDVSRREKSNDSNWRYDAKDVYTGYSPTLAPFPPIPVNTYSYGTSGTSSNTVSFNPRLKITDFALRDNTVVMGVDRSLTGRHILADFTNSYTPDTLNHTISQVHFKTQGFYLQDDWKINANDRVILGYRTQNYSESNAGTSNWYSSGSASASEFQYVRKINNALTGFVKSSQNFRLPNVDDNNSVNSDANWNPIHLMPQVSRDIDFGANYQAANWRSEVKVFRSNIRDEIAFDPSVNGGYGGNINYEPTKREGVSLRQTYQIDRSWDIRLNLHHVKATFTQGTYANNLVPNTARNSGNVQLGYQLDSVQKLTWMTRFSSDKFASGDFQNNQSKISGYWVHDMSYMYKHKDFSLTGTVNNIFNKQYTDLGIFKPYNSGDGYYYIPPYNLTVYPNPGRSFNLVGRYNF